MQKSAYFGRLFILLMLIMLQFTSVGQSKKNFVVTGKIAAEVSNNGSGTIQIAKTGGGVTTTDIPKNGRFRLELEYFNEFTLTFMVPGNLNKTIIVSTDIPQEVWEKDNDFPPFPMVVQLVKEVDGVDKSVATVPSGKIFYSKQTDNFEKESLQSDEQIAEQIKNAKKQSGQVKKEQQIIAKQESQDLAAKQKTYDQTISAADALFNRSEYLNAMLKYQDAKKLFPDKPYANDRIAEIQDLVKALENTGKQKAEQEQKYKDAIARANGLFENKTFNEARSGYENALTYKPGDVYATGQIKEIERQLALQGKQKQYEDLIAQADNGYKAKKLDEALTLYTQAKKLVPEQEYPQNQINLINQEKQQLAKANQVEKDYQALIVQADKSFDNKDYANAQTGYTKAVALKAGETYPVNRIKEIEQLLQKEQLAKQLDDNYKSVIARADKSFATQRYEDARTIYNEALAIKPTETYPASQISRIDGLIAEKEKQQKSENEYLALVGKGDSAFNIKDYEAAKTNYTGALALKPNSTEVKTKIKNTDAILQKLASDKKKEDDRLMALAKDNEKAYNTAVNAANKNVTDKRYAEAKVKYQEALNFMPEADYPKQQIARLEALLAQADAERQQEELYTSAFKKGETLLANKDYANARTAFVKAAEIKPAEQLPLVRIRDIDKVLADLALEQVKNETLKSNYLESIKRADEALAAKDYASAKGKYEEALAIKPSEQYPKNKIAQIDQLVAAALLQKYKDAITAGDLAFKSDKLDEANSQYELALTSKANDPYAKKQLAEIVKRKVALEEEQNRLKKLDEQYTALIAEAGSNFTGKEYLKSKEQYQQALALKPQETLPKEKIALIDGILNELKNAEEINQLYAASMATGEAAFSKDKLKEAREAYQAALGYKPAEPIPAQRITEIDALIARQEEAAKQAAQAEAQQLAKEKAEREQYDNAIAQADQAFAEKQYPQASTYYNNALAVLPKEKYPRDQITKIDALIAQEKKASEQAAALAKVDTAVEDKLNKVPVVNPTESLQATEARAQSYRTVNNYDEAIRKADDAFGIKDYTVARFFYYKANEIKPREEYPRNQIELIRKLVDSELSAVDRTGYDNIIAQGDDAFNKKNYTIAKFHYYKALEIKSWEKYPKDKIHEILVLTNSLLSEKEEQEYNSYIARADEALVGKDISIARFYYNKAIAIKKNEEYPKIKLKDIQSMLSQDQQDLQNAEYNKVIELADQALQAENYSLARFNYNRALGMRPDEKYPRDQLKKIRDILNKTNN